MPPTPRTMTFTAIAAILVFVVLIVAWPALSLVTSSARSNTGVRSPVGGRLLAFNVVKHMPHYDVVRGHARHFLIKRGVSRVSVSGLGRCSVVKRTTRVVVLRTLTVAPTVSGPLHLHNVHDRVYRNVDFEGSGSGWGGASGIIYITGASHDITFSDCTIGTNQDGIGNGVKIVDSGAGMHDITFVHCTFKYQPRMGLEVIGRANPSEGGTGGKGYQRVNVMNSTFEASAGEAISYDDDYAGNANRAGHCTVSGNVVKGAGVGNTYQYGQVFEINGTHDMRVTHNTFYAGRDGILNLQMHDTARCGWVFSKNIVDATHVEPGITVSGIAQPLGIANVYGGVFAANTIVNFNAWNIAYIKGCHGMDWRTTSWFGPDNVPYQTESSGNLF